MYHDRKIGNLSKNIAFISYPGSGRVPSQRYRRSGLSTQPEIQEIRLSTQPEIQEIRQKYPAGETGELGLKYPARDTGDQPKVPSQRYRRSG